MKTMAVIVMAVMVSGVNSIAAAINDPPKAAEVKGEVKHELTLRKVSRDHDVRDNETGQIRFEIFATGFEDEWVCWSKGPRITRLTDRTGKSLIDPERGDHNGFGEWVAKGKAYNTIDARLKGDRIEAFGSVEIEAEITVARDFVFLELGELKGLDKRLEIAPDAILTFRASIKEKSFSFVASLLDERKDRSTRMLVGLETFDNKGQPSEMLAMTSSGFPGFYMYRDGRPMPHTGRLVLANKLERIPLRFIGTNVKLNGMSLQDLKTMTVEEMEKKLAAKVCSDEELVELVNSSIRLGREDLGNVLVDAGAQVTGRAFTLVPGNTPETADPRGIGERLFIRHLAVAERMKNQEAIDKALSLVIMPGYERVLPLVLKCHPQLIWKHGSDRDYLITMRVFRTLVPEIADAYAHEVLTHGPDFEAASRKGFSEFLAAAYMGDDARLTAMLKEGTDVGQKDEIGENALDWACVSPHATVETVKLLLDAGVETGTGKDGSKAALVTALERKRNDLALLVIRRGGFAGIASRDVKARALELGAGSGSVEVLNAILESGVSNDWESAAGLIREAAKSGDEDVMRVALAYVKTAGTSAEIQKRAIDSGLGESARAGKVKTVKMLLEAGADISAGQFESVLARAAARPEDEMFEIILAAAIKQNLLDKVGTGRKVKLGEDAMIAACGAGNKGRVEKLFELGVVPTGASNEYGNVLTRAAASGSVELVALLLDKGVDVNAPDQFGYTAIFCAVGKRWSQEMTDLLVKRGADLTVVSERASPATLVGYAVSARNAAALKAVVKAGAPIVSVRKDGMREDPLALYIGAQDVERVKMLIDAGVNLGAAERLSGPKGEVSTYRELAKQVAEAMGSERAKEILKLIEAASK